MNKGYAFGFLLVLLVVALGFYVAYTTFQSAREALAALPTGTARPPTRTPRPTIPPTPTETALPTPEPAITATLAITPTAGIAVTPEPALTLPPASPTPIPASPTPAPTVPPVSAYAFRADGPVVPQMDMGCCYILGTIRDPAGNGLPDVWVVAYNDWNRLPPVASKGGGEAGQYNIPIGASNVAWYVQVVDPGGAPISPSVIVQVNPEAAPAYRVDWRRSY